MPKSVIASVYLIQSEKLSTGKEIIRMGAQDDGFTVAILEPLDNPGLLPDRLCIGDRLRITVELAADATSAKVDDG